MIQLLFELFVIGGLLTLLYKFVYKTWTKLDIKEKEDELLTTVQQFETVSSAKNKFKDIEEKRKEIEKFKKL